MLSTNKEETTDKPYCLMPWIHFHVSNGGVVKACCVANSRYGNINKESLEEIWNGEAINKIRDKFLKGESDKRCANCHKLEATGAKRYLHQHFGTTRSLQYSDTTCRSKSSSPSSLRTVF